MHRLSSRALASIIAMAAMTAFALGAWLLGPGRAASLSSANVESNSQRSSQSTRAVRMSTRSLIHEINLPGAAYTRQRSGL
jgi:hypothetical protein